MTIPAPERSVQDTVEEQPVTQAKRGLVVHTKNGTLDQYPRKIDCPHCGKSGVTTIQDNMGSVCCLLCGRQPHGPTTVTYAVEHRCSHCKTHVGTFTTNKY